MESRKKIFERFYNDTNRTPFNLGLKRTQQPTKEGFVEL